MKDIVAKSGGDAKLRLRGKGSGFVERDLKVESPEPLQLCISCPTREGYDIARRRSEELMLATYEEHRKWCADKGLPDTTPELKVTEKHFKGDGGGGGGNGGGGGGNRRGGGGNGGRGGRNRDRTPPRQRQGNRPLHAVGEGPPSDAPVPAGAPSVEDVKRLIGERNDARKSGDFKEADRIRDDLKDKGVVLSDEKGGHGSAQHVTSWRYWTE